MKITKMIISLMVMVGLAASSFAAGPAAKPQSKNVHNGKVKIEQKAPKQNVKVVKVVKEAPHKHHNVHHRHMPKKEVIVVEKHYNDVYRYNSCNDGAAAACAAVLGVGLIAAAISTL